MSGIDESDYADFLDELPTRPCGEGGCAECDAAFHASCDPLIPGVSSVLGGNMVLKLETWEEDTTPATPVRDYPDALDIDPYSAFGHDWSEAFTHGGEG